MQQVLDRRAGRQNYGRRGQAPIRQQTLRGRRRGIHAQGRGCGAVRARSAGCRGMAAAPRASGDLRKKPGPAGAPSKGAMGSACRRIPRPHPQAPNGIITGDTRPGSAAGDPAGLSGSRKVVWLDIRTGDRRAGKGRMKLHALTGRGPGRC